MSSDSNCGGTIYRVKRGMCGSNRKGTARCSVIFAHKGPVGAWHILSACMNDEVVETRKAVTEQLAVAIKEVSDKTATTRLMGLLQTMRMTKG